MSRVSYLLKQSLFNFAYLILTMMTAAAISLIEITWLKMVLFVLNIALYATIVFFSSRAQGEKEKKQEYANDIERRHVAETGDYVNINEREEYRPLNGFFTGLITCIPLLRGSLHPRAQLFLLAVCNFYHLRRDLVRLLRGGEARRETARAGGQYS